MITAKQLHMHYRSDVGVHCQLCRCLVMIEAGGAGNWKVKRGTTYLLQTHDQCIDGFGTQVHCSLPQVAVENFSPAHPNVLRLTQGLAYIHLSVRGGDHLHFGDLAINDVGRQAEFVHHAEWNGSSTRLQRTPVLWNLPLASQI